jgi:polysaccharide export outer membrane protein
MAAAVLLSACGASLNSEFNSSEIAQADERAFSGVSTGTAAGADEKRTSEKRTSLRQEAAYYVAGSTPGSTAYKIGPQDVIEVSVFMVPELSRSVQVADSGTVNLPLVGDLPAAGRTAQELERDLVRAYGARYLKSPQVTVSIKEYNSQRVTIEGAVKTPGVYPLRGKASLLQLIATAGGLDQSANSTVVIFRTNDGKRSAAKFDLADIRSGTSSDPTVQSGDVIIASTSAVKEALNNILKALPIAGVFAML